MALHKKQCKLSFLQSDLISLKILSPVILSINFLNSATTDANHSKHKTSPYLVDNVMFTGQYC